MSTSTGTCPGASRSDRRRPRASASMIGAATMPDIALLVKMLTPCESTHRKYGPPRPQIDAATKIAASPVSCAFTNPDYTPRPASVQRVLDRPPCSPARPARPRSAGTRLSEPEPGAPSPSNAGSWSPLSLLVVVLEHPVRISLSTTARLPVCRLRTPGPSSARHNRHRERPGSAPAGSADCLSGARPRE